MNEDGAINFREFLIGFGTFSNETLDKQIASAFRLLDPDDTGEVTKERMTELLLDACGTYSEVEIPEKVVKELVDRTYEELEVEVVDKERFSKMVFAKPSILKWF